MENKIGQNKLFIELTALLKPIGLVVVDVRRGVQRDGVNIVVTITNKGHTVGVDECSKAHRLILPRLSILEDNRDISLEVSTPGLQRNFRDLYEFTLFEGSRCRVLDNRISEWVEGIIEGAGSAEVTPTNARIGDKKEVMENYKIPHSAIQKAKLAYAWEDMNNVQ
ncbi:MAG TPA: ribosome assembly cofactor RimP [Spirochaetales bacterium]|nr:ribosome assembly cofactor RimP [Spirochaetales bacterium]